MATHAMYETALHILLFKYEVLISDLMKADRLKGEC